MASRSMISNCQFGLVSTGELKFLDFLCNSYSTGSLSFQDCLCLRLSGFFRKAWQLWRDSVVCNKSVTPVLF